MLFPCNQFGEQEPGTAEEIQSFCASREVDAVLMEKIDVNGPNTAPVYQWLKTQAGPEEITWNFGTYYIVDPEGHVTSRMLLCFGA
jgi:glutathione peroxidase